jgi:FKBP-type peptidyl-prolyl cis-trans isomerase 2
MAIEKGNKIKLEYEGKLEDGTIFDSSKKQDKNTPLEFTIGENMVIPGFEKAILGMEKDQEKEIILEPKEAYGERNELMVQKIPKEKLPEGLNPKKGSILALQSPDGRQIPVPVIDVSETDITLDMNHPLAGKKLIFNIKILEVE